MLPSTPSLPPGVARDYGHGQLERLTVHTPACSGEIYLQGAHVTGWTPAGQRPVIWMSGASRFEPGRPIRGGIPICFPWFGPHRTHSDRPPHGFARLAAWRLDRVERDEDDVTITTSLPPLDDHLSLWPHRCAVSYAVRFGRALALELSVRNLGEAPCTFEEAFHAYFAVGDVRKVTIEGLAGTTYVDKMRDGARSVQDAASIRFVAETDRVYLGTTGDTTIADAGWQRRIVVEKVGSRSTVLWNPWIAKAKAMPDFGDDEWPWMVCVETGNALEDAVTLPPGEEHRLRASIRVE